VALIGIDRRRQDDDIGIFHALLGIDDVMVDRP
jgi:hypothetical protein